MIPSEADANFVASMEDVLDVCTRPYDPARPVVCLDEVLTQLTRETHTPLPHRPGREARFDYEYERAGVASMFMLFAPLVGWHHVSVCDRRTAADFAHVLRDLSDVHFPKVDKITLGGVLVKLKPEPHTR